MGRRTRMRIVKQTPDNKYFQNTTNNCVTLTVAEFEAMRLKHYINLNQKDSSENMGVSQPTFSRILETAHQKITTAFMEGKDIRVHGGNVDYKVGFLGYGCLECDHEWEDDQASKEKTSTCPKCNSKKVYFLVKEPL